VPARAATPAPVAVIPPVAPVPAIAPVAVPPLAVPGAPDENSSLRVAARAVATGEPPAAASDAARQDPGTVVTVPAGSSLSDLMLAVYGQYNSQMMQRVQAVNPQVTDPDFIVAGDRLRFPEKATPPAAPGTEAR
jgi:nucleoid-associated protein YgaU